MEQTIKCLIVVFLVTSLVSLGTLGQRDEWCEGGHDHDHDHDDPHPEDFLVELFHLYGDNATCTIQHHEYEHLLADLGIGEGGHAPHVQAHRAKRSVDHTCYDGHELLEIFNVSEHDGIKQGQFIEMSPALIQQVVQGCEAVHESHDPPSAGEVWGYSILAVAVVSFCALFGLILARWRHSSVYKYLLTVMLGLAVGTLLADSIMHLIPHGLGLHAHDDHDHGHEGGVEDFVWKTLVTCLSALAFFNLQMALQYIHKGHSHSHGNVNIVSPSISMSDVKQPETNGITAIHYNHTDDHQEKHKDTESNVGITDDKLDTKSEDIQKAPESMGWMVAIGDGFHNFADGMAIGAAFSDSWQTGLGTSIAIFFHELPHEFGDVAAQLSVGWSWKRVLLIQCVSQSTAFLGLCIGIPISENVDARDWILIITAGMFLYIAMSDIIPELFEYFRLYTKWKICLLANAGILSGFLLMLIISILEGVLHF